MTVVSARPHMYEGPVHSVGIAKIFTTLRRSAPQVCWTGVCGPCIQMISFSSRHIRIPRKTCCFDCVFDRFVSALGQIKLCHVRRTQVLYLLHRLDRQEAETFVAWSAIFGQRKFPIGPCTKHPTSKNVFCKRFSNLLPLLSVVSGTWNLMIPLY